MNVNPRWYMQTNKRTNKKKCWCSLYIEQGRQTRIPFNLIFALCLMLIILGHRIPNNTQMKVTKMLLVISTVFVILNLPSYVIRVWIFIVSVSKPYNINVRCEIVHCCCFFFVVFLLSHGNHIEDFSVFQMSIHFSKLTSGTDSIAKWLVN